MKQRLGRLFLVTLIYFALIPLAITNAKSDELEKAFEQYKSLSAEGSYKEATKFARMALNLAGKRVKTDHPILAMFLRNLADLYYLQGRYAEAEPLYKKSLEIIKKAFGPEHTTLARAFHSLAMVHYKKRRYLEAEPLHKQALEIYEKALGDDHPKVAEVLSDLADIYNYLGRYSAAEPLYKQALEIYKKSDGNHNGDVATSLLGLGQLYYVKGRFADAEHLYKKSLEIKKKVFGPEHPQLTGALNQLALVYQDQGRYAEAETLYKQALTIDEKTNGIDHPDIATLLNNIGTLYQLQSRYVEAESLYKRVLKIHQKISMPDNPAIADALNNLAYIYTFMGRYAEAEPLYEQSLTIYEKALGAGHVRVAVGLANLAQLYMYEERYAEAELLYKKSFSILEKTSGPGHPLIAELLANLGGLYQRQRRFDEAVKLYKRSLEIIEKALGTNHPTLATVLDNLGSLYRHQWLWEEALPFIQRATELRRRRGGAVLTTKSIGADTERKNNFSSFREHVDLAFTVAKTTPSREVALYEEAFEVVQLAQVSSAGSAFAQMTARFGSDNKVLAETIRSQQDLHKKWRDLDKRLMDEISKPNVNRKEEKESQLRYDLEKITGKLKIVDEKLSNEFPQYLEIANPKPLKVPVVQKLLKTDEALVVYKDKFVWVVTKEKFRMLNFGFNDRVLAGYPYKEALERAVTKIREAFQLSDGPPPLFPKSVAHALYRKIFEPIEPELTDIKRVLVVPDAPLTSLPFSVLISSGAIDEKPQWLAEKYAFTTLPSVSSLKALRTLTKGARPEQPFIGFGDPVFSGTERSKRAASQYAANRGLALLDQQKPIVPPLPETAGELKLISAALGNTSNTVYLQNDATEKRIKEVPLDRYRVVAFATHGLLAGERPGLMEPALLFTAPHKNTKIDDGILTASEVMQLKMNAEWVLLSACNTAAGNKPNAEGLSGLAKAFFYAGSKSLLVSHWKVHSLATTELITGMFDLIKRNDKIGKAEALRQSMLKLIKTKQYSHPAYWAPFSVIGTGD